MIGPLIGMVHLAPLPGSPRFGGQMASIVERAVTDAQRLEAAGFDAVLVENFGDAPFYAESVPAVTVAAMTRAIAAVRDAVDVPLGVNVLRNDATSALSIATACDASFIRVNVLSGTMYTDQGVLDGHAAEIVRLRAALAPEVAILADVFVKHAVPPPGLTLEQATADLCGRGGADALIVTGTATGKPADPETILRVRTVCERLPILVGSGVTVETVADILRHADGVIVGTALEVGGATANPVDPGRAAAFVAAVRRP